MSPGSRDLAIFRGALLAPAATTARADLVGPPSRGGLPSRADQACASARRHAPKVFIATINPPVGDTGVQTHTRTLHDGLATAGVPCEVVTPFPCRGVWMPIFAARKLIRPVNRSWSTRWYRHWHAAALRGELLRRVENDRKETEQTAIADAIAQENPPHRPAITVLAQCPVSAEVALEVRARLGLDFPVAMACHFNFSEAREYRDKGELPGRRSYQAMLDFEQRVLGTVDRVIYVSSWAKRIVEEERGIPVRNSSVIWNGISAAKCAAASRASIGLNTGDLVLINVGTLEKRKNQLGLLNLFATIAQRWTKARLVLVGDGPDRGEVCRRIDVLGLRSKVRMLGMRRDVPALLAAADMYVHYAAIENCPVALLEAARESLPIAAVPGGGVPELLEILGGVSLDSTDTAHVLDLLRPLLADASARRRAGQVAREAFERCFTREAMVGAYENALGIAPKARSAALRGVLAPPPLYSAEGAGVRGAASTAVDGPTEFAVESIMSESAPSDARPLTPALSHEYGGEGAENSPLTAGRAGPEGRT